MFLEYIVKQKPIEHEWTAESEVLVLEYEESDFLKLLETFPDINEEVRKLIEEKTSLDNAMISMKKQIKDKNLKNSIVD